MSLHGVSFGRAWVALLVTTSIVLAGCTTEPDALDPEDVNVVTDPNDFSYLENQTARAHVHDYWGGLDRLVIADDTFSCSGISLNDPLICGYRPDSPIPLGTGLVEVTIDWTVESDPRSQYEAIELWVKTAQDQEPSLIGRLEDGDRITLETSNEDADLPHQRISSWEFSLYIWGDRDAPYPLTTKSIYADIDIFVEAVRTLEIPLFPGHPDIWQNRTAIPLVTDYRYPSNDGHLIDGDEVRLQAAGQGFNSEGDDRRIRPMEGAVIPVDAAYVEVVVDQRYETTSNMAHLRYHGADGREWLEIEPIEDDGYHQVYHIPVEGNGDSPYALTSLWEFFTIFGDAPGPGQSAVYKGSYTVEATVYKEAVA